MVWNWFFVASDVVADKKNAHIPWGEVFFVFVLFFAEKGLFHIFNVVSTPMAVREMVVHTVKIMKKIVLYPM